MKVDTDPEDPAQSIGVGKRDIIAPRNVDHIQQAGVEFSFYKVWVDRTSYLPIKAEYYDREGRKYRAVDAHTFFGQFTNNSNVYAGLRRAY